MVADGIETTGGDTEVGASPFFSGLRDGKLQQGPWTLGRIPHALLTSIWQYVLADSRWNPVKYVKSIRVGSISSTTQYTPPFGLPAFVRVLNRTRADYRLLKK